MEANELAEKVESFNRADFMQDNIFKSAQKVENLALSLGRRQMAHDILKVLVDKMDRPAIERLNAVIDFCDQEAKK